LIIIKKNSLKIYLLQGQILFTYRVLSLYILPKELSFYILSLISLIFDSLHHMKPKKKKKSSY
jgi:hypothetical protein